MKLKKTLLISLFSFTLIGCTHTAYAVTDQEKLTQGLQLYKQGDHKQAIQILGDLAKSGNADAQFEVAQILHRAHKWEWGAYWYLKAAKNGHQKAQNRVGKYYGYGDAGFPFNNKESIKWLEKAAEKGDNLGYQYDLAMAYRDVDNAKAVKLFKKLCKVNYGVSCSELEYYKKYGN